VTETIMLLLHPSAVCRHCRQPVYRTTLMEGIAGGGWRPVEIWVHASGHHERCAGAGTYADPEEGSRQDITEEQR
jgi:hypothetical protein